MKLEINTIINACSSLLSGWVLLLSGLLGEFWYLFAVLLLLNTLDWLTGWYRAYRAQQESSKIGLQGALKKLLYWVMIAVAFATAAALGQVGNDVLGVDLTFLDLLGWFVTANLIINEARSITENLVQVGVAVPAVLTNGLQVAADLLAQGGQHDKKNDLH